jgi:hypothetical protein
MVAAVWTYALAVTPTCLAGVGSLLMHVVAANGASNWYGTALSSTGRAK